jgi:hypothetical protein
MGSLGKKSPRLCEGEVGGFTGWVTHLESQQLGSSLLITESFQLRMVHWWVLGCLIPLVQLNSKFNHKILNQLVIHFQVGLIHISLLG